MTKRSHFLLGAAVVLTAMSLSPDLSFAQAGVAKTGQITEAEAAQRLLQTCGVNPSDECSKAFGEDLRKNGIDVTDDAPVTTKSVPITGVPVEAGPPIDGKIKILNCSQSPIRVKTYNTADIVYLVPYQDKSVAVGTWGAFDCASSKCKVKIGGGKPSSPISGTRRFKDGKLSAYDGANHCG